MVEAEVWCGSRRKTMQKNTSEQSQEIKPVCDHGVCFLPTKASPPRESEETQTQEAKEIYKAQEAHASYRIHKVLPPGYKQ